ncbi:MAG: hypothetical protein ACUVWX_07880 [Kiritimatiellia bacterium]
MKERFLFLGLTLGLTLFIGSASANVETEFTIKREPVFEFAVPPRVTKQGDRISISFATKGRCDVTVAVENEAGVIVRHLASGVLGPNAPAPFEKNSLKQTIVWDGKDDQGTYIDDKERVIVRVSLGLNPRFERTLFWSPKKRIAPGNRPLFAAAPEGVYVYEGGGVDHIRLFDHDGNYVRTVYPFPPNWAAVKDRNAPDALQQALAGVKGLRWVQFPQDNAWYPLRSGLVQASFFTSGDNTDDSTRGKYGCAASAFALDLSADPGKPDMLALVKISLNRMATDGTTGGLELEGPKTAVPGHGREGRPVEAVPRSAAFSPNGKWLYLAGYHTENHHGWLHGVMRLDYRGNSPPELFVGAMSDREFGTDNEHFRCPMSVACDSRGRVYIADYHNDRIQVYDEERRYLKTIAPVTKPVNIFVHPKTGEIHVISWMLVDQFFTSDKESVEARYTRLGPLEDPKQLASYRLPMVGYNPTVSWNRTGGRQHEGFVDCYTDPPVIWLVPGKGDTSEKLLQLRRSYSPGQYQDTPWNATHYRLFVEKDGQLVEKVNFAQDVAKAVVRVAPPQSPAMDRQRLYVDPTTGYLYIAEGDSGVGKAFRELVRIVPDTGETSLVQLPFTTEEIAFDLNGRIYLRTDRQVSRFELSSWREIPWDYGEIWETPGFDGDGSKLMGALPLPGSGRPGCFHLGGFAVSPRGNVVVSCYNVQVLKVNIPGAFHADFQSGRPYQPPLYPGRLRWGEVHVWDQHGRVLYEDAVPGLPMTDGLAMDKDDNIYVLVAANRVLDEKEYPLERAETLMKFRPKKGKLVSSKKDCPVPIDPGAMTRPPDITRGFTGRAWVEGVEWMYGGVGFGGFNSSKGGGGCACWNARFALDLFGRSFATELNRSRVAVLDTNGNLILRLGKYGNVDDGLPLVLQGGPQKPRSIGDDEVGLCHHSYVATHTDHRLFIADYGNFRILSVRLDYHTSVKIPLRDVAESAVP